MAIKNTIGIVMNDIVAKLIAVKAGFKEAAAGIKAARPMLVEQISVLNNVANEPTMMNGMYAVNAFLIAVRYWLPSTFSATSSSASSNFSEKAIFFPSYFLARFSACSKTFAPLHVP